MISYDGNAGEDRNARFLCSGYEYCIGFDSQFYFYASLTSYYGIVLAYDIASRDSWEEVTRLQSKVCSGLGERKSSVLVLVLGLKADMEGQEKRVPRAEAEAFATLHGYRYAECSAITEKGVHEAFGTFVENSHATDIRFDQDAPGWEINRDHDRMAFSRVVVATTRFRPVRPGRL